MNIRPNSLLGNKNKTDKQIRMTNFQVVGTNARTQ